MITDNTPDLTQVTDNFLHDYFAFYPTQASMLGLHEYDGQIPDLSSGAIQSRIATLKQYHNQLAAINPDTLDRLAFFDYSLLHWRVEAELWNWTEHQEYTYNPFFYTSDAMVDTYVKRNYAPLEVRTEALTRHLHEIPRLMAQAREHLGPRTPQALIEQSIPVFQGLKEFFTDSLDKAFHNKQLAKPLMQEFWNARDKACGAIESLCSHLQETLLPSAPSDFAIGAQQFSNMLRYNELVDLPLDQLLAAGESDLSRNLATIEALANRIDPSKTVQEHMRLLGQNHPTPDRLLEETHAMLENLRSFLIERDLVTIPNNVHCFVEETPPYERWAFAMMDTAGPFEQEATESFYYVTLPEPDWPPDEIEAWMTRFDYATMTGTSIHEAYPGHYVHYLRMHQAPTRLSRVFDTYSHSESWAHYAEQMMLEQGFGNGDLSLRMAQLGDALVRNCRYICAIKMHTQGMSIDEATAFFVQNAYMDRLTASREAGRGTHEPGYINYTLGKLMLLKLLDDYKAAMGQQFSLKQFHDTYIGYGSPPIPLLRKMMLPDDDGKLL